MAADTYARRDLYGGALSVSLPHGLIDTSDLRQVPDHQEVFLSRHSLTSIIFEINEYQDSETVSSSNGSPEDTNVTSEQNTTDLAAAIHHLTDTIPESDHLDPNSVHHETVAMQSASLAKYPAYSSTATIIVPEVDRTIATTLPPAWQSEPTTRNTQTRVQQLLVRMQEYITDLVVRIYTPLKEYEVPDGNSAEGATRAEAEYGWAREAMRQIVATLEVKNFEVFGEEE